MQIGTEHLLLALVLDPGELGGLLREKGFQAAELEREIYALHGVTPGPVHVDEDLSPRPRSSNVDPHAPPRPLPSSQEIAALRVIDAAANRVTASIPVGKRPWGVAITADGRKLYVANGASDDVSVIDTATLTVVATVKVGSRPWGLAIGR